MMPFSIESLAALEPGQSLAQAGTTGHAQLGGGRFAQLMERELGDLSANVSAAESAVKDMASGKPVELHDVMISLERARLGVQAFVQIRNKLVESYQDLMRMQL